MMVPANVIPISRARSARRQNGKRKSRTVSRPALSHATDWLNKKVTIGSVLLTLMILGAVVTFVALAVRQSQTAALQQAQMGPQLPVMESEPALPEQITP